MIERIPPALDGERIDRVVAMITGCQPRSSRRARRRAGRARRRRDRHDPVEASPRGRRRRGARRRARRRPDAASRRRRRRVLGGARRPRHRGRSTSPPGWWCTPVPATSTARSSTACSPATPRSRRSASPTVPASSTASTRARPACWSSPAPSAAYESPRRALSARTASSGSYLALAWGHVDPPRGLVDAPIGRSDREPTRMAVASAGVRHAPATWSSAPSTSPSRPACSAATSRPGARTRSACTSRRSATRSWATTSTAAARSHHGRPAVPARRPPGLRPPGDRRARRVQFIAAGRSRRRARDPRLTRRAACGPAVRSRPPASLGAVRHRGDVGQREAVEVPAHVLADLAPDG